MPLCADANPKVAMLKPCLIAASLLTALPAAAYESKTRTDYIIPHWDNLLRNLQLPPLPVGLEPGSSRFRFTVSAAWQPPMFVWIETFDDGRPARVARMAALDPSGRGTYAPGTATSRHVSDAELAPFRAALTAAKLCGAPLEGQIGNDGFTYNFEFANATRYCAATRWAPQDGDPFSALGQAVLNLAQPPK